MLHHLKSILFSNYAVLKRLQKDLKRSIYELVPEAAGQHVEVTLFDVGDCLELVLSINNVKQFGIKMSSQGSAGLISILIDIDREENAIEVREYLEVAEIITDALSTGIVQMTINEMNSPVAYINVPVSVKDLTYDKFKSLVIVALSECNSQQLRSSLLNYRRDIENFQAILAEGEGSDGGTDFSFN